MNFIEAVQVAKEGKKIRKSGWSIGDYIYLPTGRNEFFSGGGEHYPVCAGCILADDWEVVLDPPKTIRLMSFTEAMAKVKDGRQVKRQDWKRCFIAKDKLFSIGRVRVKEGSPVAYAKDFIPTFDEIEATDWVVVEEEEQR